MADIKQIDSKNIAHSEVKEKEWSRAGHVIDSDIDAGDNSIKNLSNPVDDKDAANREFVDRRRNVGGEISIVNEDFIDTYFEEFPEKRIDRTEITIETRTEKVNKTKGAKVFGDFYVLNILNTSGTGTYSLSNEDRPPELSHCYKIEHNSIPSSMTVSANYFPGEVIKTIGIWVRNPTDDGKCFTLFLYDATGTKYIECEMAIKPNSDWTFLTASNLDFQTNTLDGTVDTISSVKVIQRNENADYYWPDWKTGDYILFGHVQVNFSSRPKFIISFDDLSKGILYPESDYPTSYPVSGGTWLDICNYYGFKAVMCTPINFAGRQGRLTWDEIKVIHDNYGWDVIGHGNSIDRLYHRALTIHLSTDGSEERILHDLLQTKNILESKGYRGDFLALPSGIWDQYTHVALKKAGIKAVRGVQAMGGKDKGSLFFPQGYPSNSKNMNTPTLAGNIHLPGALLLDYAYIPNRTTEEPNSDQAKEYIDNLIYYGAAGISLNHIINSKRATVFDKLLAYLRLKVDADEIDVVTFSEWYQQTYGYGDNI